MATEIAFGAYIPGSSLVHNMKAQVKIVLTCAFCVFVFFIDSWLGMIFVVLGVLFSYKLAQVPIAKASAGLAPLAFVLLMTILCHALVFDSALSESQRSLAVGSVGSLDAAGFSLDAVLNALIAHAGGSIGSSSFIALCGNILISIDGLASGFFFAMRIALIFIFCALLTFTTSVAVLLEGLESLLRPFSRFRLPVADICLIASIALRFVPTITEEAQSIRLAQEARGSSFEGSGLFCSIKAWCSVFTPLFVRLFKRSADLALVLDARCYGSGFAANGESDKVAALDMGDIAVIVFGLSLCVAMAVLL